MTVLWPALASGLANELSVQGTLLDGAGSGLDGTYELTFTLYDAGTDGNVLWTETQTDVVATAGFFDTSLGADLLNPLTTGIFNSSPFVFVGIKVEAGPGVPVGGDPELGRKPITKVAAAFVADIALNTMTFNGLDPDQWIDDMVQQMTDNGFLKTGDPLDETNMAANGLNEVSNDLMTNQFTDEVASSTTPKPVLTGVIDQILFPDIGSAEVLTVNVSISSTEPILQLDEVTIKLTDPKGAQYTLFEQGGGAAFAASFPDPTATIDGDLTTWIGDNPKGTWILQVIDLSPTPQTTLHSWSIALSTLSNQKVAVQGNLIVSGTITGAGGTTIDGDMTVTGSTTFENGATINGHVVFADRVTFGDSWCPARPSGEKSLVVNGVCVPGIKGSQTMQNASIYCTSLKADLCTDSQNQVLRAGGLLMSSEAGGNNANWSNSYSGDDSARFRDATGSTGDNHGPTNSYIAPCCYNVTPARPTDQIAGTSVRVVHLHDVEDSTWGFASQYCGVLNADLCSKAQYQVMRDNSVITQRMWANDHSDNDGSVCNSSIGAVTDDPAPDENYGFACCATSYKAPESNECPAGVNETAGVCWVKASSGTWTAAVSDCDANGAQLCSISQTYVLRVNSILGGNGNWTQSHSDNDSGHLNPLIGSSPDNPTNGQTFNYACCL